MKGKSYFILLLIQLGLSTGVYTQPSKPRIMVIPLTINDQDPRTVYENDSRQRYATAKLQELLLEKGAYVIDFLATVKAIETEGALNGLAVSDVKTMIIDYSNADFYFELELADVKKGVYGSATNVTAKMYDAYTQELFGAKVLEGEPVNVGDPLVILGSTFKKADTKGDILLLLDNINAKFGEISTNGRNIKLIINLETDEYDLDAELPSDITLKEEIQNWLDDVKNAISYDDIRGSGKKYNFPGVRIPLTNAKGRKYKPSHFANDMTNFIKKIKLSDGTKVSASSTSVGGLITITLK